MNPWEEEGERLSWDRSPGIFQMSQNQKSLPVLAAPSCRDFQGVPNPASVSLFFLDANARVASKFRVGKARAGKETGKREFLALGREVRRQK